MDEQDALPCVERHATSKIREATDLGRVSSFGFRGEALPSIASVSRFEILTRPADAELGTRVRMEGGTLLDVRQAAAAPGTVVEARNLFFNLPARREFLRTVQTELGHCVEAVSRMALGRPDVGFVLKHAGRRLVDAPVASGRADRAADILGPDARKLVPIDVSRGSLALVGLIAPPGVHRASGNGASYLFVNGRWVRDLVLRRAVHQAYRDLVPRGRYPVVILDLLLPGEGVDVNVHPTKAEVRFQDPAGVAAFVERSLREALVGTARPRAHEHPRPATSDLPLWSRPAPGPSIPAMPPPLAAEPEAPAPAPTPPPAALQRPASPSPSPPGPTRLLGLIAGRYAVGERDAALWLVDAGRLARRIGAARARAPGRRLLAPVVLRLPPARVEAAEAARDALSDLGLDLMSFSPTEVAVRAVPPSLSDAAPDTLLDVALAALARGRDVRAAWAEELAPGRVDDDPVALRTLLAAAREAEVQIPERRLDPGALL